MHSRVHPTDTCCNWKFVIGVDLVDMAWSRQRRSPELGIQHKQHTAYFIHLWVEVVGGCSRHRQQDTSSGDPHLRIPMLDHHNTGINSVACIAFAEQEAVAPAAAVCSYHLIVRQKSQHVEHYRAL